MYPLSYAAARLRCERTVSSSCSSRVIPHSFAMIAAWSPIDSPVRGSMLPGMFGTIICGRIFAAAFRRSAAVFERFNSSRILRRSSLTPIGASEVVSTPPAAAAS